MYLLTLKWLNSSIWSLIDIGKPVKSRPRSNRHVRLFHISQSSRTGASQSDGFVSYPRHLLGRFFSSAKVQRGVWVNISKQIHIYIYIYIYIYHSLLRIYSSSSARVYIFTFIHENHYFSKEKTFKCSKIHSFIYSFLCNQLSYRLYKQFHL